MKNMNIEMSSVKKCSVVSCGYNVGQGCHAKAITVGDPSNPDCDTFFSSDRHNREVGRIAGVGACKVSACRFNDDFECTAESIEVGMSANEVKCLTYSKRAA